MKSGKPLTPKLQKPEGAGAGSEPLPSPAPQCSAGLWNVRFSWGCLWAKCSSQRLAASQLLQNPGGGVRRLQLPSQCKQQTTPSISDTPARPGMPLSPVEWTQALINIFLFFPDDISVAIYIVFRIPRQVRGPSMSTGL